MGREFVHLAVLIDVFGRGIRGWHLYRDLSSELTHRALDRAMVKHGPPKVHQHDHEVQYLMSGYVEKLQSHVIAVSCLAKGKPSQNGKCERFIRTHKESEVYLNQYVDLTETRRQIRRFLANVYMTKRIHSILDYIRPVEFEAACVADSNEV